MRDLRPLRPEGLGGCWTGEDSISLIIIPVEKWGHRPALPADRAVEGWPPACGSVSEPICGNPKARNLHCPEPCRPARASCPLPVLDPEKKPPFSVSPDLPLSTSLPSPCVPGKPITLEGDHRHRVAVKFEISRLVVRQLARATYLLRLEDCIAS